MVPVGTRLMLLFCVLYELRDSNNRLTYCKLGQFLFWCCTLLFLCGRNLFVFLRIVFNTALFVCYSVLWPQISNIYLLTYWSLHRHCFADDAQPSDTCYANSHYACSTLSPMSPADVGHDDYSRMSRKHNSFMIVTRAVPSGGARYRAFKGPKLRLFILISVQL